MKQNILEFVRRGLIACGFGPLVLAALYVVLQSQGHIQTLTVNEVCIGIVSLTILAFIVGGMGIVYQIERLPLMVAIFMHGAVLYVSYLITYLVNGWLDRGIMPLLGFSCIFVLCYLVIWLVIYAVTKRKTDNVNQMLKQIQQHKSYK